VTGAVRPADYEAALLNILEDFVEEKDRFADVQRAMMNILEDAAELDRVAALNRDMAREIAERRKAEADLRRANAEAEIAKSELEAFAYSVAHDLRAPLRSVDGFGRALLEDCGDRVGPEGEKYLGFIRDSIRRMSRLIDALLDLSRLSRAELKRTPVDLALTAREAIERLRRAEPERDVAFFAPTRCDAEADERLAAVVLDNLLQNAWKFTSKKAASRIEFGRAPPLFGKRAYFVRDDGAGFDMAYASKLFGVFQRVHGASEFPGTGVGLATVLRVVRRHGGDVRAEGTPGEGAAFYFSFGEEA
jgi:signal transduction histidine kinase